MLVVPTSIGTSPIHGIGLFAKERIPKGTLVWEYVQGMDRYITDEELEALPPSMQEFIHFYFFRSKITGQYLLLSDNDRFTNHSYNPNVGGPDSLFPMRDGGVALRDIEAGEEITNDYSSFDMDFHLYSEHFPREEKVPVRAARKTKHTARGLGHRNLAFG